VDDAAKLLRVSRQAIDKRRKTQTLLAVRVGRRYLYPAWQFGEAGALEGLAAILDALRGVDAWARMRFFLNGNAKLAGERPLSRLRRGDRTAVLSAARAFGEHGAA
jgi:hypothetical protein